MFTSFRFDATRASSSKTLHAERSSTRERSIAVIRRVAIYPCEWIINTASELVHSWRGESKGWASLREGEERVAFQRHPTREETSPTFKGARVRSPFALSSFPASARTLEEETTSERRPRREQLKREARVVRLAGWKTRVVLLEIETNCRRTITVLLARLSSSFDDAADSHWKRAMITITEAKKRN